MEGEKEMKIYTAMQGEDVVFEVEYDPETQVVTELFSSEHVLIGLRVEAKPGPTLDEVRESFKLDRQKLVDVIKVTTAAGYIFDGDETSQTRMARAIAGLADGETMTWVLADNSVIQATKSELLEALRLSGRAQESIWVMP